MVRGLGLSFNNGKGSGYCCEILFNSNTVFTLASLTEPALFKVGQHSFT